MGKVNDVEAQKLMFLPGFSADELVDATRYYYPEAEIVNGYLAATGTVTPTGDTRGAPSVETNGLCRCERCLEVAAALEKEQGKC